MSFFKQLRDRRMFRIIAGYVAAGWVVLQVIDQLVDQGVLPAFLYPLTLIWYVAGIPAAALLGWYHGEKGAQRATKLEVALLAVIFIMGLSASGGTLSNEMARRVRVNAALESTLDLRRIGVLYFEDLTPGRIAQHIADGFTEALIDELAAVRELDVVSRNGVAQFRGVRPPRDSIAQVLGTGTLVDGTVEQIGDRLSVTLRLIDGQSGAEYRRAGWERPVSELLRVRADLVTSGAAMLREWLGEEVRLRRSRQSTDVVAAWTLYHSADRQRIQAEEVAVLGNGDARRRTFARADSLLAHAEVLDAQWPDPPVLRGHIAYRSARLTRDVDESLAWVRRGLHHIERALALEPNHARALELRGTLNYWEFLQEVESDPDRRAAMLQSAKQDLERAIALDPRLASAHASLSHLHLYQGDEAAAVLASRRALEEDAWLDNADVVMWRLVTGSYNLERFAEAKRWCDTGKDRFPDNYRFVECELLLMTTPAVEPVPDRAWELLARLAAILPPNQAEYQTIRAELLTGGVLARASLADSARAVLLRARQKVTPEVDPVQWLYFQEAYLRTILGDFDEAVELLKRYAAVNPGTSFEHYWWWRELRQHPRYREIAPVH